MSKYTFVTNDFRWAQNMGRDTPNHYALEGIVGHDLPQTSVTLDISYSADCPLAREFHDLMNKISDLQTLRDIVIDPETATNQKQWCIDRIADALNGKKINLQDCPAVDLG